MELGSTLIQFNLILTNYLCTGLFSNKVMFWSSGWIWMLGQRGIIQPLTLLIYPPHASPPILPTMHMATPSTLASSRFPWVRLLGQIASGGRCGWFCIFGGEAWKNLTGRRIKCTSSFLCSIFFPYWFRSTSEKKNLQNPIGLSHLEMMGIFFHISTSSLSHPRYSSRCFNPFIHYFRSKAVLHEDRCRKFGHGSG